jgi:hypothetical protein
VNRLSLAAERLPENTRDTILTVSAEIEKQSAVEVVVRRLPRRDHGNQNHRRELLESGRSASRTSEQLNQAGVA